MYVNVSEVMTGAGVTEEHRLIFGTAISEGYAALRLLSKENPMLGSAFLPGSRALGYLRNVAVQHALQAKAKATGKFETDIGWNVIRNHAYVTLKLNKVQFTSHYLGPKGTGGIRKAIYRSELQCRNGDLFASEAKIPDIHATGEVYAQIVHGGLDKPVLAAIRIPNRDYLSRKLSVLALVIGEPDQAAVEKVKDQIDKTIRKRKSRKGNVDEREAS